jgi:hypothetical protein
MTGDSKLGSTTLVEENSPVFLCFELMYSHTGGYGCRRNAASVKIGTAIIAGGARIEGAKSQAGMVLKPQVSAHPRRRFHSDAAYNARPVD